MDGIARVVLVSEGSVLRERFKRALLVESKQIVSDRDAEGNNMNL